MVPAHQAQTGGEEHPHGLQNTLIHYTPVRDLLVDHLGADCHIRIRLRLLF
jgi:hypothetical protein